VGQGLAPYVPDATKWKSRMTNSTLNRPKPSTANTTRSSAHVAKPTSSTKKISSAKSAPKPQVVVRARLVSYPQTRKHARAHRLETAVFRVLMFLCLAMTAYGVSSVGGQVAVEKSRREELSAVERTKSVKLMEAALRSDIVELSRPDKIDSWALANEFENAGVTPSAPKVNAPSTLVALRD
jgi:hypothetical protein